MSEPQVDAITQKLFFRLPEIKTQLGLVFGAGALTALVATKASEFYLQRKIPKFITTGGVEVASAAFYDDLKPLLEKAGLPLPQKGEKEGDYAARVMKHLGVPTENITIESESTNTGENVENAMPLGLENARSVTLFSLAHTQWRSLATLRRFSDVTATTVPVFPLPGIDATNWHTHPFANAQVHEEYAKLDGYIAQGFCHNINIATEYNRTEQLRIRQQELLDRTLL